MNKRKRSRKTKDSGLKTRSQKSHSLDIRKLFLRDAPKRTGYKPVPGVSIYPQNFKEPRVLETFQHGHLKRECCNDVNKDICRCGDVVACPASQEFQSKNNSEDKISNESPDSSNENTADPIDFRGLRGMLWSKINPKKLELFERRFSEPNATGSSPVILSDDFGTPMFFTNSQPASSKFCDFTIKSGVIEEVNKEDINLLIEMCQNCMNYVENLEQDVKLNMELQLSIENELERGIKLLKSRLRQLTISERKFLHICVNNLTSQVGFPKIDNFIENYPTGTKPILKENVDHIVNHQSWFMGIDAMDIVTQHHKIADLQGKLMLNHLNNPESHFSSNYNYFGFDEDEVLNEYKDIENKIINEDNELSLRCRSVLSKYLGSKLHEKEQSLMFKRNLLIRLSNILKLLESSPLSNFPFTINNRHMFLNPIGIGRNSISWIAFDFVDLVSCVLKLYRLEFLSKNELQNQSMFSSNVSISSNTHKLKVILQNSFSRLRKIKEVYAVQINKIKKKEIPLNAFLFLKQNSNVSSLANANTIKNRQMNHGISDILLCNGVFEWHTPLSLNSTIVEIYSHLECYDLLSYTLLNGKLSESTALMYIRSLLRLFLLFSSFESNATNGIENMILPIKASRIYIRKEDCCFLIGPLEIIDLNIKKITLEDDEINFKKRHPTNLMRCNNFIKSQKDDNLINYLPPIIKNLIVSDDSIYKENNLEINNKFLKLKNNLNLSNIFEKIHIYMLGVLLYYCLTCNYYEPQNMQCIPELDVSTQTKELLNSMLTQNISKIPSIEKTLEFSALHPEKLTGTVGIQSNYNLFQNQLSELKFEI